MKQRSLFPAKGALPRAMRAEFEAFWAAYPPRSPNPRAMAEAAFAGAMRAGVKAADLVTAAGAYAAEVKAKGIGEAYIVHAQTFLRQQRFLDYLQARTAVTPVAQEQTVIFHALWPALKGQVGVVEFQHWLMPLQVVSLNPPDIAELLAPSRFHRDWVRQNYAVALRNGLRVRILDIDVAEDIRP